MPRTVPVAAGTAVGIGSVSLDEEGAFEGASPALSGGEVWSPQAARRRVTAARAAMRVMAVGRRGGC